MNYCIFPALLAAILLTGCPQPKTPDTPPLVPQPKAALSLPGVV